MIFQIEWTTYDSAIIHHFEGPEGATEQDFRAICDKLMHEALQDAIDGKPGKSVLHDSPPYWLGYDYGVDEIVARLPEHGYKEVKFPTVNYSHGSVMGEHDDHAHMDPASGVICDELRAKVVAYNAEMHRGLAEKRLRQKMLRTETNLTGS